MNTTKDYFHVMHCDRRAAYTIIYKRYDARRACRVVTIVRTIVGKQGHCAGPTIPRLACVLCFSSRRDRPSLLKNISVSLSVWPATI